MKTPTSSSRYSASLFVALIGLITGFIAPAYCQDRPLAAMAGPHPPQFVSIDFPGATWTDVSGINASGDIVGSYLAAGTRHGFTYIQGSFTSFDYPGAIYTDVLGLNAEGVIVGFFRDSSGHDHPYYLEEDGTFTAGTEKPGATETYPFGVNSSGVVVGEYKTGQPFGSIGFAYLERDGEFTELVPPGSIGAHAYSINASGDVVGRMLNGANKQVSWLRDSHGTYTIFEYPGASATISRGINDHGTAVGVYFAPAQHGFLRDRHGNFASIDYPGAPTTRVLGINNRGDIVGTYKDTLTGPNRGFLVTGFTH